MLVRLPHPLRPACFLVGAGLVFYLGCSSSGTTAPSVTHPTMIEVAPEDFLGQVPCATEGSGLKRYVATLVDRNFAAAGAAGSEGDDSEDEEAQGFQSPSSLPTPCLAAVGFGFVVPARHYEVLIDGYDTDAITPRATGSRKMMSTTSPDGEIVAPRWTTQCKRAIAVDSTIVRADHCDAFPAGVGPGSVRIALARLLGDLACGTEAGQVDHLSVSLTSGETTQAQTDIPCDSDAEAVFDSIPERTLATAYVSAFGADGIDAFAGASCHAVTLPGVSVDASCALLSTLGTLRVDLPSALGQLGVSCKTDEVSSVSVKVPGEEPAPSFPPPACLHPFDHGFPAGPAVVTVSVVTTAAPDAISSLSCHAEVVPGQLVVAECEPNTDN